MEFLKYRAMDVFRYILPGLVVVFSALIINPNQSIFTITDQLIMKMDLKQISLAVLIAYIIGFCIDPIGRWSRYNIAQKIWKAPSRKDDGLDLTDSERYVLIKHFSEGNYKLIETWDMLKGMAANLSVGTTALMITGIYKIFTVPNYRTEYIFLVFISIAPIFLFLHQASYFERFSVNDMTGVLKKLKLVEMAKELKNEKIS